MLARAVEDPPPIPAHLLTLNFISMDTDRKKAGCMGERKTGGRDNPISESTFPKPVPAVDNRLV